MKIKRLPQKYNKKLARDFGYLIKKMREECGLSQLELAKEIGLKSATAISLGLVSYILGPRQLESS